MTRAALFLALLVAPLAAPVARAQVPPIAEVPEIFEGLMAAAIAYEIGEVCDPVDARRLQGIAFLLGLEGRARREGFTDEEIDRFLDDEGEQDRLEAIARQRLADLGAVPDDEASHCAVGRAQIAAGTQIGRLLSE